MHEIITLSLSPHANHITTHFNNLQESQLHITPSSSLATSTSTSSSSKGNKLSSSGYDPDVHFSAVISNPVMSTGTTMASYYPRTLLWEYENGFGSLGQFEYFENVEEERNQLLFGSQKKSTNAPAVEGAGSKYDLIQTTPRVPKNAYQKALDSSQPTQGKLNVDEVKYWSDFSRFIYKPISLNKLKNWQYDTTSDQGFLNMHPERKFEDFSVGVNEFKEDTTGAGSAAGVEFIDENFRKSLEDCDLVNGINVITEVDSAWSGFSSSMLDDIRDEYLPKLPVITWGVFNDSAELSLNRQLSRIRAVVGLLSTSSLFVPMPAKPKGLPEWVKLDSLWHVSSFQCVPFDFVNSLVSQKNRGDSLRTNFTDLVDGLTGDQYKRNVVSDIKFLQDQKMYDLSCDSLFCAAKKGKKKLHKSYPFAQTIITKPLVYNTGLTDSLIEEIKTKLPVSSQTPPEFVKRYDLDVLPFNESRLDSFPPEFNKMETPIASSLTVTDKPREMMTDMYRFVSKYCRGDDREELKDELDNLKNEYEAGWYDDSDSDNYDDY